MLLDLEYCYITYSQISFNFETQSVEFSVHEDLRELFRSNKTKLQIFQKEFYKKAAGISLLEENKIDIANKFNETLDEVFGQKDFLITRTRYEVE